jgi:hypothetical protein
MNRMQRIRRSLATMLALALGAFVATAVAQVDLSGNWQPYDHWDTLIQNGPPPGDFVGVPLNEHGRAYAATADAAEEQEELHRQCQPWLVDYIVTGPFGMQIQPVGDRINTSDVIAWQLSGSPDRQPETIWMDGRSPPPPQAPHTWAGFAIGHWQGSTLAVSVTRLKDGWLTRNDAPESEQASVNMFLNREQDLLTITMIIHDPVYLAAPYVRYRTFKLSDTSPAAAAPGYNGCLPAEVIPGLSDGYHSARFLPGKNPHAGFLTAFGIPPDIALGGPEQMYPEYREVLKQRYRRPGGYCTVDCCGAQGVRGNRCPTATTSPRR